MAETQISPESEQPSHFRRYAPLWHSLIGVSIAMLSALFFFSPIMTFLTTPIVAVGFDPLPTELISALFLISCASLVSALVSRQRFSTAIGAGITYGCSYVLPFLRQELSPHYDPAGHLETLNASVLTHAIAVLLASGLLCAFLGAAIGSALGEMLLDPIWQLAQLIWRTRFISRLAREQSTAGEKAQPRSAWKLFSAWTGFFMLLGIILLSNGIGNLLFYSPDVGIYSSPSVGTHGTLIADSMISPALHGQRRSFLVYLPPSYLDTTTPERRYPTLYLLHGSPGSEYDWISGGKAVQSADALIGQGKIPELIMIFPDGNGQSGETSEWGNSFDQQQLMENFVALDLVHFIDQKYRTIPTPGYRAIGGFSMGGFGAMNIAVHHPDIFGSVISLAGYYLAEGSVWGQNMAYMQANSPALVLPTNPKAWKLHIFLGAGTKDQPYYTGTQQFILELKALHIDYTFDLENGYHTWSVWEIQLYHGLLWLQWR
ncbi:MAG TPA: alpha/beta hydrolase-fold protein [Ktedonobacteraceae bacterium]|nr:alpha/beta hydrolase-fold protein [Ktedonobacteraceae bacterium]